MKIVLLENIIIVIITFWFFWKATWFIGYLICWAYTRFSLFTQERRVKSISNINYNFGKNDRTLENWIHYISKHYIINWIEGYYRYKIIKTGHIASHVGRNLIYSHVFKVSFSKKTIFYYGAEIRKPYNLQIGSGSIIGDRSVLDARCGIIIGDNVNLSSEVHIWTLQHNYNCPDFSTRDQCKPVVIKDRAWIGPRATILPGVTIGEGAVIGAGAVVTKDVNPYTLNVGIPSKQIGFRATGLKYCFSGQHIPFL